MRKAGAFTVLEMVLVLGLVVVIMWIMGPQFGQGKQCMAEDRFWQSFRQEWQLAQMRVQLYHLPTTISYSSMTNSVDFTSDNHNRSVSLPSSLRLTAFTPIEMKADGYVCPGNRCFYSRARECRYRLVIQMARGEFDVEKEE